MNRIYKGLNKEPCTKRKLWYHLSHPSSTELEPSWNLDKPQQTGPIHLTNYRGNFVQHLRYEKKQTGSIPYEASYQNLKLLGNGPEMYINLTETLNINVCFFFLKNTLLFLCIRKMKKEHPSHFLCFPSYHGLHFFNE